MATGIEVWTWVIAEKPVVEVVLISEILAAWFSTVRERKGVFSQSLKSGFLPRIMVPAVTHASTVMTIHSTIQ